MDESGIGFDRFPHEQPGILMPGFQCPARVWMCREKNFGVAFPDSRLSGEYQSMSSSHLEAYFHFTWTTYAREPLSRGDARDTVLASIAEQCRTVDAEIIALNAVEDYVHLFVRTGGPTAPSMVIKQVKGASSRLMNKRQIGTPFRWQESYGGFSISRWDVAKVCEYIERQQEHHRNGTTKPILEPE